MPPEEKAEGSIMSSLASTFSITVFTDNEMETFSAATVNECPPKTEESFNLTIVDGPMRNNGRIVQLMDCPEGSVYLYDSFKQSDIDAVMGLAARSKAAALLVRREPSEHCSLPVFVVPIGIFLKISKWKSATVTIDRNDVVSPETGASNPDVAAFETHSFDEDPLECFAENTDLDGDSVAVEASVSTQDRTKRDAASQKRHVSSMELGDSSPDELDESFETDGMEQKPSYAAVAKSQSEEKRTSKKGWMQSISSAASSVVDTLLAREPQKRKAKAIFFHSEGWNMSSNLCDYRTALHKIDDAVGSSGDRRIQVLAVEAETFLGKGDCNLYHIAAVMYMYLQQWDEKPRNLAAAIFTCLRDLSTSRDGAGLFDTHTKIRSPKHKPHNIMFEFLTKHGADAPSVVVPDTPALDRLRINIFWVLDDCGLCRRKITPRQRMDATRRIAGAEFFERQRNALSSMLGPMRTASIGLLLQTNLKNFVEVALRSRSQDEKQVLEPFLSEIVLLHIESAIQAQDHSIWRLAIEFLRHIQFRRHEASLEIPRCRESIVRKLVGCASYKRQKHFKIVSTILLEVRRDHADHHLFLRVMQEHLKQDLSNGGQTWEDMRMLLTSTPTLLSSYAVSRSILTFAEKAMEDWGSFDDKLLFIDKLHETFVRTEVMVHPTMWKDLLIKNLRRAIVEESSQWNALSKTLLVAAETPRIFMDERSNDSFVNEVATCIFDERDARHLLAHPVSVKEIKIPAADIHTISLYTLLICRLREVLEGSKGNDIRKTARLYAVAVATDGCAPDMTLSIVEHVFVSLFRRWNPQAITDLSVETEEVLGVLFRGIEDADYDTSSHGPLDTMEDCQRRIKVIVDGWVQAFNDDAVSEESLLNMRHLLNMRFWKLFESFYNQTLPDKSEVEKKLDKIASLTNAIAKSLSIPIDRGVVPLHELLKEYNCIPSAGTPLNGLLRNYSDIAANEENGSPLCSVVSMRELRDVRVDAEAAEKLNLANTETMLICAYFLHSRSVLFRDAVISASRQHHTFDSLVVAVERAMSWLKSIFGCSSHYAGVKSALNVLSSFSAESMEEEVAKLVNCRWLNLSKSDRDNFFVFATLADFEVPLEGLVFSCRHFGFAVVNVDSNFDLLCGLVEKFFSSDQEASTVDICLAFSRSLCRLLCPDEVQDSDTSAEIRDALLRVFPVVELLATFSRFAEVWIYAREMKWFGEEGLKRFYEEHSNVTNVLLGNSQSYEMSLLDAMEPTMRVVSAVGGLLDEPTIAALVTKLRNSDDVAHCVDGDIARDIRQVHEKLSEIRDWFSDGVDEIAAAYSLYDSACRSGRYSITFCLDANEQIAPSKRSKDSLESDLTLEFIVDRDGERLTRKLHGGILTNFIQQLSLIQNENLSTANAMQEFVEQYQILTRATQNVLRMHSVGYEKISKQDVYCGAGAKYLEEANHILKRTEIEMNEFKSWLSNTRAIYKVSLLFWTEELRDIHAMLDYGTDLHESLAEKVERLSHLCSNTSDRTELCGTVRSCLDSWNNRGSMGASTGWLVDISRFLEEICKKIGVDTLTGDHPRASEIVLHSLSCGDGEEAQATLQILQHIYKDRLPLSFEVLDGFLCSRMDHLEIFLERVQAFTSFRFVIKNVDKMESKLVERLVSFLSDREIAQKGFKLNCIQHGESLIHTAPWIAGRTWDPDTLLSSPGAETSWKELILDKAHLSSVTVVAAASCGGGKTRLIRERLEMVCSSDARARAASIVVHEKSSAASLALALAGKFEGGKGKRAVHFSFAFLPSRNDDSEEWFRQIDHFFFSLLVLRSVYDPALSASFALSDGHWDVLVELPFEPFTRTNECTAEWLCGNMPALSLCCTVRSPSPLFIIDHQTRRVCTYLRAFEDGTINRKFEGGQKKRLVLVLDRSGSMQAQMGSGMTGFDVAINNAVRLFDSHIADGDEFGVVLFDHDIAVHIPIQEVRENLQHLRRGLLGSPFTGGGTNMYTALSSVLASLRNRDQDIETWIVCLTDGASADRDTQFRPQLVATPTNFHLIVVGVNLGASLEAQMHFMCAKYANRPERAPTKGFFVSAASNAVAIDQAFGVVKSRIPVSQTFELDGALSDRKCRQYMRKYLPEFVDPTDMISQAFWVRFLYRRVKVFDENHSFNYNESHDSLGSSLMEVMLGEVERLLSKKQSRDWIRMNHAQLIYDFSESDSPEFRLLCTAPNELDEQLRQKLASLDLPGFFIPTQDQLEQRVTLDRYLSQALDIPLSAKEDGSNALRCIDESKFVLTLDFTMKLLSIHERVACRIPCIIEGETGVSKTALTQMYAILRNASLQDKARERTQNDLMAIEEQLRLDGIPAANGKTTEERLHSIVEDNPDTAKRLLDLMEEKRRDRSSIFQDYTTGSDKFDSVVEEAHALLDFFSESKLERTFFDINIDSSLTESDVTRAIEEVRVSARNLESSNAIIVVFLDEINTSSVLGLLKEITIDHSIAGEQLEDNIVVVAACNPPRAQIQASTREKDLGRDWASGHYQVARLPSSMNSLKWSFGSLNRDQEKDFIFRRIEMLHRQAIPPFLRASLTEVVSESHEAMRKFAERNIYQSMTRSIDLDNTGYLEDAKKEANSRARSIVSLRDIQRVFALFDFFSTEIKFENEAPLSDVEQQRCAMLLATATVYYLRLDSQSRHEFLALIKALPTEQNQKTDMLSVLNDVMDRIIEETDIPDGIAVTRGLKENIFATLVCSLSRTPLIIVGPPGSSKTLSVNTVSDNANGTDSIGQFYRERARLSIFHYQCSKQSTSKEIAHVFDQATQRQNRVDDRKHRCVVFMDEAGLPEEETESLKVLHYLLEGHMSAKSKVGFVAISNHVLDAAKSNRCIMLLRQEPDGEEMLSMAMGVLFDVREDGQCATQDVDLSGAIFSSRDFASKLCASYLSITGSSGAISRFSTFFGLRDFVYFLKSLRSNSKRDSTRMELSLKAIIYAIERNFNGVSAYDLRQISVCFLKPLSGEKWSGDEVESAFRDPLLVIKDALSASTGPNRPRFKLIIDCTDDDSILRLLKIGSVTEVTRRSLFKLSHLPDEVDIERLRLISGVKFAALQGHLAVLSQTEPVNESFYDLFNQRFQEVKDRDENINMYANIAVGGMSRRSLVKPGFECIVHVRESLMEDVPAPFLNRFEKYRLSLNDVLVSGWSNLGRMAVIVERARQRSLELISILTDDDGLIGWDQNEQTVDSVFVGLLPHLDHRIWSEYKPSDIFISTPNSFSDIMEAFLKIISSLYEGSSHIEYVACIAQRVLAIDDSEELKHFVENGLSDNGLLQDSLRTILSPSSSSTPTSSMCESIIQMIFTRVAIFRLVQLATPEAIFRKREMLPKEVLEEYFRQGHFSLKRLISRINTPSPSRETKMGLTVVYTRSDQLTLRIPSLPVERLISSEETDLICRLVHDKPDLLVVEHMSKLRSEALVRGAIDAWAQHETRSIFLLLVDMSDEFSVDCVNFVRMCVEQHVPETTCSRKFFFLLLHYSPSVSRRSSCYPPLFLGGWEHFFLDGIGHDGSGFGAERFIEFACIRGTESLRTSSEPRLQVNECIKALLPRVLTHIATQIRFYQGQNPEIESFHERKRFLSELMLTTVGDLEIGDIICQKFAKLWLDSALVETMKVASDGLLCGTTHLSMSMSIHSVLVQAFHSYLALMLVEMNQWRNLDVVKVGMSRVESDLFGRILRDLPFDPFEELLLQKQKTRTLRLIPLPAMHMEGSIAQFPFFFFVSRYIDEAIERVFVSRLRAVDIDAPDDAFEKWEKAKQILREVLESIEENEEDTESCKMGLAPTERRMVVRDVIQFVQAARCNKHSLFNRYLTQFIEWKIGGNASPVITGRFKERLAACGCAGNIVAIHVVARVDVSEFMRLASMTSLLDPFPANENSSLSEETPTDHEATSSRDFFNQRLRSFERNLLSSNVPRTEWSVRFSQFLRQSNAMLTGRGVEDAENARRLRILSFFHIFVEASSPATLVRRAEETWLDVANENRNCMLNCFLSLVVESRPDTSGSRETELMLRHFFSPRWMKTTSFFKDEDFRFLLDYITNGKLVGPSHQLAISLLKCACGEGFVSLPLKRSSICRCLSSDRLLQLNTHLKCDRVSDFSDDGKRNCIPHFVPDWLVGQMAHQATRTNPIAQRDSLEVLFANYHQCFDSELAKATFGMLVELFAEEAEHQDSEKMFLLLLKEIDSETSLSRKEQTLQSRLRSAGEGDSLRGSPLAGVALSARMVCFVAKVAYEVAVDMKSPSLNGAYKSDAVALIEMLMSLKQFRWQDFFISTILRLRGEGTLSAALAPNGPLSEMDWCTIWANGVPVSKDRALQSLQQAEAVLAEATLEERRKSTELRLCPHCRQPFIIAQMNCGQFTCGRDAHLLQGRPNLAGAAVRDTYGCGQQFNVNGAPHYVIDETILAPLRDRIDTERTRLGHCENGEALWGSARSLPVPPLVHQAAIAHPNQSFLPSSHFLSSATTTSANDVERLVQLLLEAEASSVRFSLLPDMIELYMWLHGTFRYLITREKAHRMLLSSLMKKECLQRRFDSVRVNHLLSMWDRLRAGINSILLATDRRVRWNCEEVIFPFDTIEQAPLVAFLSESGHPTDGNDFLFLLINETIDLHNQYVQSLSKFTNNKSFPSHRIENDAMQPKFIVPGFGGAIITDAFLPLSKHQVNMLVESCWDSETQMYDVETLGLVLGEEINLYSNPPLILDPMKALRESFYFRDDESFPLAVLKPATAVTIGNHGDYFVHYQDAQLADDVVSRLLSREMSTDGDNEIRRTLNDSFHNLEYNQVRGMLEGSRSFLDLLNSFNVGAFESVASALVETTGAQEDLDGNAPKLQDIGFPTLSNAQSRLVLSLDQDQFVEMIKYLAYQLATEAYLFANLPLYMTEPLNVLETEAIGQQLKRVCETQGAEKAVKQIDEFARDVLSFYEAPLRDRAMRSNQPLRSFLVENNFCDSSDPVFRLVPRTVTLRHYISLQQLFQQTKLSFLCKQDRSGTDQATTEATPMEEITRTDFNTISRGRCWLWEDPRMSDSTKAGDHNEGPASGVTRDQWKLWFETAVSDEVAEDSKTEEMDTGEENTVEMSQNDECPDDPMEDLETRSARLLQRWWRRELCVLAAAMEIESAYSEDESSYMEEEEEAPTIGPQRSWTRADLYNTAEEAPGEALYGAPEEEIQLRQWLDENSLPQLVGDDLVKLGVRNIRDVVMLVNECQELLESFAKLDALKLKRAVASYEGRR